MRIFQVVLVISISIVMVKGGHAQSKCTDKLRQTIWKTLNHEILSDPWDCEKVLEDRHIRLGRTNAFILRGVGDPFCGVTGNCSTWVVVKGRNFYRVILYAGSVTKTINIKKRAGKRYPDLVFRGRMGASDHYLGTFRFNGHRYKLTTCVNETYSIEGRRSVSSVDKAMCEGE
jgi:hypothetical protein